MPGFHRRRPSVRSAAVVATLLIGAAATGCSGAMPGSAAPGSDTVDTSADEPASVDNCGVPVTLDAPPERVVTIKSTTTEMMLALGLGERIVGVAFQDGPLPPDLADEGADLVTISERVPGQEALLDAEPDFVFAGWESNFDADGAGDRAGLARFGVETYVAPSACKEPGHQPDPMTFDLLHDHVRELADLFEVPERADALITQEQGLLDQIDRPGDGLSALWFSSGEDTPYVGAEIGAPAMMMRELGLENIFSDVDDTWSSVSWEQVIERDPDVIILVDAEWNTAQNKIEFLESNAATAAMPAVQQQRYLTVPFPASEAGVRNAPAVVDLADQLTTLGVEAGP